MSKKYIKTIPEDAFCFIDKELSKKDNVINLSIGNPIDPPNGSIINNLNKYIQDENVHGYGFSDKDTEKDVKKAISRYYKRRFNVELEEENQVALLNGTKEGIYYLLSAMLDEGDKVLIPSPSYSVYMNIVHLIGGQTIYFPCDRVSFIPDLDSIKEQDLIDAKVMVLCSPGNPTTKILPKSFLQKAISLAKKYDFKIIHDVAYGELCYENNDVTSILSLPNSSDVCIELYSLSKSCNVAGWRIGFALGCKEVIENAKTLKYNVDFGTFIPFQKATIDMLDNMETYSKYQAETYKKRIDYFVSELNRIGWSAKAPEGSFFLWVKIPDEYKHMKDTEFISYVLDKTDVLMLPGSGFGYGGKGYVRIALVEKLEVLKEAIRGLEKLQLKQQKGICAS
ncbi:pyridoxal phosphate-dependent aminotransferase [Paraclostridium sordellii]|uniref:pyridoxal phosphate-dependent aminotransferase n=1 Tax=Paraclostridium sordellii TaxID=1505 RepID=UPI0022E8B20F|nr:pyridoxal phosphate-dependent aminotransferase [Paeniclostridium sordellii]